MHLLVGLKWLDSSWIVQRNCMILVVSVFESWCIDRIDLDSETTVKHVRKRDTITFAFRFKTEAVDGWWRLKYIHKVSMNPSTRPILYLLKNFAGRTMVTVAISYWFIYVYVLGRESRVHVGKGRRTRLMGQSAIFLLVIILNNNPRLCGGGGMIYDLNELNLVTTNIFPGPCSG